VSPQESSGKPKDPIESTLFEFGEAWFSGERPDPEAFCKKHPEYGPELQSEIEDFLYVAERLPKRDQSTDGSAPPEPVEEEEVSGRMLGEFRINREIGWGGMGGFY
jgi:hypothetical protein